jgi:hypothetical protein
VTLQCNIKLSGDQAENQRAEQNSKRELAKTLQSFRNLEQVGNGASIFN